MNTSVSHLFIPEGSQAGFRSIEICAACLAVSRRLRVGSGVIRILEHDAGLLASRLLTLQDLYDNRFVLGVGTGPPTSDPRHTISSMLERLGSVRERFGKLTEPSSGLAWPETFVATLRKSIAKAVASHSDGILLNFCPPEHARGLIESLGSKVTDRLTVSCYLKLFYSRNDSKARHMLVEEFAAYNRNPNYHKMFEEVGVGPEVDKASSGSGATGEVEPAEKLLNISLANPKPGELAAYVTRFREAGVDLPCLYPYFDKDEDEAFRMVTVKGILQAVA